MLTVPQMLMAASALVIMLLGLLHLLYTFRGNKLFPRDTHLERQMQQVSPVLTNRTTMWDAWIGFNASHSYGAIFFGLVYGYLAIVHAELLFHSAYFLVLGLAMLCGYAFLAKRYWFRIPYAGILIALALYLAALVMRLLPA